MKVLTARSVGSSERKSECSGKSKCDEGVLWEQTEEKNPRHSSVKQPLLKSLFNAGILNNDDNDAHNEPFFRERKPVCVYV